MQQLKLNLFGSTLLLATIAAPAMASQADYQVEAGYELRQRDLDNSNNANLTTHLLSFEYFLEPVKIDNQPLAEAAFMNRISSLAAGLTQSDVDADDRTADGDGSFILYTHMQQDSPLRLQVLYVRESADYTFKPGFSSVNYSYDRTVSGISLGGFIAQNTTLAFEYIKDEVELSPGGYSGNDYTLTQNYIVAKHLMPVGNGNMVNMEGTIGVDSYDNNGPADTKNTVLEVKGEYYLNNMQSIGGTFKQISGDDNGEKGQAIAVHGRFFFTPKFSVAAQLYRFSGDGTSNDSDQLTASANMRF